MRVKRPHASATVLYVHGATQLQDHTFILAQIQEHVFSVCSFIFHIFLFASRFYFHLIRPRYRSALSQSVSHTVSVTPPDAVTRSAVLLTKHSFIHSFRSLSYDSSMTLPKPVLYTVRSSASSFNLQYPLVSLRVFSSCVRLLPQHPVTSTPSIFPSIICYRRQFLRKMQPIQLPFLLFIVCRIFLSSSTLIHNSFLERSVQLIFSIFLQHHISKLSRYFWSTFQSVQVSAPYNAML